MTYYKPPSFWPHLVLFLQITTCLVLIVIPYVRCFFGYFAGLKFISFFKLFFISALWSFLKFIL